MASEKVFAAGMRKNNTELKRVQSIKLRGMLFEHESEYRRRFSSFVDTFQDAAKQSQCLSHSRLKTILKVMDEVLKGSDGLLVAFDKRGAYQPADAVYEQITAHRRRCADGLYTYCAQLHDICNALQMSCAPDNNNTRGSVVHDSLLPVHHVQELLDIFQDVKKDLVDNRRLVEVFGCNNLIEQLNKELKRTRKVMEGVGAESLLLELCEMATDHSDGDTNVEAAPSTVRMETRPSLLELPAVPPEHKEKRPATEIRSIEGSDQTDRETEAHSESSVSESRQNGRNRDVKIRRSPNIPLSRRDSKKQMRYQVESFASKLSEMKEDLFLLEQKLERIKMLSCDSASEDEDESMTEYCDAINHSVYDDIVQGDKTSPFSRVKDSHTKALLRSSMRRAPLYQNYQKLENHTTESSPITQPPADGNLSVPMKDEINAMRPESGIVMEEGLHNDSDDNSTTDGSQLNENAEDTSYYVEMNGSDFQSKSPNLRVVENSNGPVDLRTYSLQVSNSDYETVIYPNYTNMIMTPITQDKPENNHLAIEDDNRTDQTTSALAVDTLPEELPMIMTPRSTKQRIGWCQIPLVKESGVLERMTSKQRTLQEAKYEIISSKVSYLKSLSIVQSVFIANEELRQQVTSTEWDDLFQHIGPIKHCTEHFLSDLLSGWPHDIFLSNQLPVVRQYAESGLEVYVDFCSHKITMDDTLKNIRANNPSANMLLKKLEHEEICDGHDLESFLVLPIQRITRFPLLVEGILLRMDSNTDKDFCDWAKTYHKLRMVAKRCNDAVKDAETRKLSLNHLKSPSSTLPAKKNKLSSLWNDQD